MPLSDSLTPKECLQIAVGHVLKHNQQRLRLEAHPEQPKDILMRKRPQPYL
jgi:hypothetical protein